MIAAVDIGGTKIATGIVDDHGRLILRCETPTSPDLGRATTECTDSLGINSKLQVIGYSCSEPNALLWENGQEVDLNIFNHSDSGLQQLVLAYNIKDAGEIVGLGVPPNCGSRLKEFISGM
jgi:hypothetical protein